MPRPCSRAFLPFYRVLKSIAEDREEPTPLRLRSCELCLALRTGEWAFATGNKTATKAIRRVTAADAVDAELLRLSGLIAELQHETKRIADALEEPEHNAELQIDHLLARAEIERRQRNHVTESNAKQN